VTAARDLHSRINDAIREKQLFNPGDTLIIGLSGGADSTALLHLLATLPSFPLNLVAAHLNHSLRGPDSDADEQFCRDLAAHYKIPFEMRQVDVKALALRESLNLEDAGRRARIDFFDELAVKWKASAVVLAHHADDQAETVLMRLLRGTGMSGLTGMPWCNGRGYVRPLLDVSRCELENYLKENKLSWREDASNLDTSFLRNRIRHELLPLLEQYNPSIRMSLTATAGILSDENQLLDALTVQTGEQFCSFTETGATCPIPQLRTLQPALQRRLIRLMLSRTAGSLECFSGRHLGNILQMAAAPRPNLQIHLPRGLVAVREYETLTIRHRDHTGTVPAEVTIPGPGSYQLPDGSHLQIELTQPPLNLDDSNSACFDCTRMPFPWQVRTFLPGDRIQPLGMDGRKKVKDIFIDDKIPLARRRRIPLVFCGDDLIWIVGLRTSHLARIDEATSQVAKAVF